METWNDENAIYDQARSPSGINYILPRAIVLRGIAQGSQYSLGSKLSFHWSGTFVHFSCKYRLKSYGQSGAIAHANGAWPV